MIVLGMLLLIVVIFVAIVAVAAGDGAASLNLVGAEIDTLVRWVFLAGAASVVVLVVGLDLLGRGLRRERKRRQEVKRLKAAAGAAGERPRQTAPERQGQAPPSQPATGRHDPDEQAHFESTPREER